jgi:hypothetical protein
MAKTSQDWNVEHRWLRLRTVNDFRKRHLEAVQALKLRQGAELVKLGRGFRQFLAAQHRESAGRMELDLHHSQPVESCETLKSI